MLNVLIQSFILLKGKLLENLSFDESFALFFERMEVYDAEYTATN